MDFIIENTKQTLIIGIRQAKSTFSVRAINIIIDAFPMAAVVSLPENMFMTVIIGAKAVITVHSVRIYEITLDDKLYTRLKTESAMQSDEHKL